MLRLGTKYGNQLELEQRRGDSDSVATISTSSHADMQGSVPGSYILDSSETRELVAELIMALDDQSDVNAEAELITILRSTSIDQDELADAIDDRVRQ